MWVQGLGQDDPLEEGMATHSSNPRTEEPGALQSVESRMRLSTHSSRTSHLESPSQGVTTDSKLDGENMFRFIIRICKLIPNVSLPSILSLLQMEQTDGVVPATLPLSYKLSRMRSQKTLILGLTPESNLLKKLGFQSQESR